MKPDKFIITMSDRPQAKREWNLILRQTLTTILLSIIIGQIDYSDGWTTSQFWASLQVRIITFRYRKSPSIWSREWSIEDWEDIIICFKHRLRHRMRLIQGAKTPVVFWLWRSRTQPRKTLRSGRGLKTLDRSTALLNCVRTRVGYLLWWVWLKRRYDPSLIGTFPGLSPFPFTRVWSSVQPGKLRRPFGSPNLC